MHTQHNRITVSRGYLEEQLEQFRETGELEMDPDFQRGHVWTEKQQIANFMKIPDRAGILKWYIDFNAGGTPHKRSEINRIRQLLIKETNGQKKT